MRVTKKRREQEKAEKRQRDHEFRLSIKKALGLDKLKIRPLNPCKEIFKKDYTGSYYDEYE